MIGEIVAIKKIYCDDEFVYNLEVEAQEEANKNYFADGVLVSNCHSMSTASADALLKLLEEPPPHVRFVLATTDVQKLRPAIQSRCQRHDFRKIYWGQIAEQLKKIAKLEGLQAEEGAINLCAKISNGSMRTAIQNFEKLLDFSGSDAATMSHAEKVFIALDDITYADLIHHILGLTDGKVDASHCFRLINKMLSTGVDFNTIYEGLTEYLRKIVVLATCQDAGEFISVTEDLKTRLKMQIKKIKELNKFEAVLEMITKLNQSRVAIEYNVSAEILLQKFVIESIFAFKT